MTRSVRLTPILLSDLEAVATPSGDGPRQSRFLALPWGRFQHSRYGELEFSLATGQQYAANFRQRVTGRDIFVDYAHHYDGRAAGRVTAVDATDQGLYYTALWTPRAAREISDGEWNYFSAWLAPEWDHPKTGTHQNVALGGALTNVPSIMQGPGEPQLQVTLDDYATLIDPDDPPVDPLPERRIWQIGATPMFERFLAALRQRHNVPATVTDEQLAEQVAGQIALSQAPPDPATVPQAGTTPAAGPPPDSGPAAPPLPTPTASGQITLADFERFSTAMQAQLALTQAQAAEAMRILREDQDNARQSQVEQMLAEAIQDGRIPASAQENEAHWQALLKWGKSDPAAFRQHLLSLSPPPGFIPRGFAHTPTRGGETLALDSVSQAMANFDKRQKELLAEGKEPMEAYSLAMAEVPDGDRLAMLGVPPEALSQL